MSDVAVNRVGVSRIQDLGPEELTQSSVGSNVRGSTVDDINPAALPEGP